VALRIAFDLDGVFADMDAELRHHAAVLFGKPPNPAVSVTPTPDAAVPDVDSESPPAESPSGPADAAPAAFGIELTRRQASRLWRHVESIEAFWESLKEIEPGALARLATIAEERCWEVIFLTKRPPSAGATAQVQSQRWLAAHGFPLPSVFVVQGSRGKIAAALALDVVVDDRPENCLDVIADSTARAILVWRDEKQSVPEAAERLGIATVRSVGECLDVLTGADLAAGRRGVVERLKQFLGFESRDATGRRDRAARQSRSRTPSPS
jgi:hypothetical protein